MNTLEAGEATMAHFSARAAHASKDACFVGRDTLQIVSGGGTAIWTWGTWLRFPAGRLPGGKAL